MKAVSMLVTIAPSAGPSRYRAPADAGWSLGSPVWGALLCLTAVERPQNVEGGWHVGLPRKLLPLQFAVRLGKVQIISGHRTTSPTTTISRAGSDPSSSTASR